MIPLDSGWPLVLSAEAVVPSQTTQRPPQLALMNPTGEPFKIHEIRFSLKNSTATSNGITGATVACKLDLGSVAITNGFVPVWNFGRVISYDQDLNNQFVWRLAHPIYVPAGGLLAPNFQHLGQVTTSITARVTYLATPVAGPPRNRKIFLPWVTAYVGKAFVYNDADTDTSEETELLNPFDTDLRISRLIGRFNIFTSSTATNYSLVGGQLMTVRISLSNGDPLVRTETPFSQVFGWEGRAWEQRNTILRPKQFFQVFVTKTAASEATGPTVQPFVSMVGYREMELG